MRRRRRRFKWLERLLDRVDIFALERVLLVHALVVDAVVGTRFAHVLFARRLGQHHVVVGEAAVVGHRPALGSALRKASRDRDVMPATEPPEREPTDLNNRRY